MSLIWFLAFALMFHVEAHPLDELRGRLANLPKEIECHFLLKLIDQGTVPKPEQRTRILEDVFLEARHAAYPFQVVTSEPINPRGASDIGVLDDAMRHGIDGLSLRARAAELTSAGNPKRAREMMEELSSVTPPPMDCRDGYGYSMKRYWDAFAVVFERGFSKAERADAKHIAFADARLRSIRSAFDIEPALRFLAQAKVSDRERLAMVRAFAASVSRLAVDPRSFQASLNREWTPSAASLARLVIKAEGGDAGPLAQALRGYLARNSAGMLCRESFATKYRDQGQTFNEFLAEFNKAVVPFGGESLEPLKPIEGLAQRDSRLVGPAGVVRGFWEYPESSAVIKEVMGLRTGDKEDRTMLEWQRRADEFIEKLQRWREKSKEDPVMVAHQLCNMYEALLDTLPAGPVRQSVTLIFAQAIEKDVAPMVTPPEWFHHILNFMEYGQTGGQNQDDLLGFLDQQGGRGAAYAAYVKASGDLGK